MILGRVSVVFFLFHVKLVRTTRDLNLETCQGLAGILS